jgi:hypothetical protein
MMTSEDAVYAQEAEALGKIGAVLSSQPTKLTMRLPRALADVAIAAWRRDDTEAPASETAMQRTARHRAGILALIGLCVESTGRAEGEQIACELDAWYVGLAMNAADEYGLLR